jgi:hypothetical protein
MPTCLSLRFPRPGLSLIKRIANDGKSGKGGGGGNGEDDDDASNIAVTIDRPSMNSRKISASIIVQRPVTGNTLSLLFERSGSGSTLRCHVI